MAREIGNPAQKDNDHAGQKRGFVLPSMPKRRRRAAVRGRLIHWTGRETTPLLASQRHT